MKIPINRLFIFSMYLIFSTTYSTQPTDQFKIPPLNLACIKETVDFLEQQYPKSLTPTKPLTPRVASHPMLKQLLEAFS